jgi:hypothetical protein
MKKLFCIVLGGILAGAAYAETTIPPESNTKADAETDVDVSKNVLTGSKTVTTTKKASRETKPGVKSKKYTKNVKKYDKNGNLIKDETDVENSAEQNK